MLSVDASDRKAEKILALLVRLAVVKANKRFQASEEQYKF